MNKLAAGESSSDSVFSIYELTSCLKPPDKSEQYVRSWLHFLMFFTCLLYYLQLLSILASSKCTRATSVDMLAGISVVTTRHQ